MFYFLRRFAARVFCALLGHTPTMPAMTPAPWVGAHLTYRWAAVTRPYCSTCGARL